MKFTQIFKKLSTAVAVVASVGIMAFGGQAAAIPYTGASTPALGQPGFNVYTGLGSNNGGVINEPTDFFMGKQSGTTGYLSNVNSVCNDGTQFDLRVYVHNGASDTLNDNGNGVGVAHNTKVKVALPAAQASNFPLSSTISASNAGSVTDGMTIDCGGKQVTLSYVAGSAAQYTVPGGTQALSDSIVTTGAPIGTVKPDGNVWGCWDQRVWVMLKVQVKVTPVVPVSSGSCKAVDMTTGDNRKVNVTINGLTNNATITAYKVDWGDGKASAKQTDTHTYDKDGTYNIVAHVQVKFADGHSEWLTADACKKQVTFEAGKPPVTPPVTPPTTPPTTLINTGAGSIASIFAITSLAGAMAYRLFMTRRLSRQ